MVSIACVWRIVKVPKNINIKTDAQIHCHHNKKKHVRKEPKCNRRSVKTCGELERRQ